MDAESDFGALYKKLIDGHFAPEPARAGSALRSLLDRLSDRDCPGHDDKTVESCKRS